MQESSLLLACPPDGMPAIPSPCSCLHKAQGDELLLFPAAWEQMYRVMPEQEGISTMACDHGRWGQLAAVRKCVLETAWKGLSSATARAVHPAGFLEHLSWDE